MERLQRGELEAQVMDVLWQATAPMTPREVQEEITSTKRPLAYTTVMTVLVRLRDKGMVSREVSGRGFAYSPVTSRDEWSAQRMREMLEASGDPTLTLSHFVGTMNAREVSILRRSLDARRKR
jgi:predicted transcriptional regulator